MGKKKHAEHVNHERWLVSYADLLTLLFAFFVVLFASSVSDKKKTAAMAAAMQTAFTEHGVFDAHAQTPPLEPGGVNIRGTPTPLMLPVINSPDGAGKSSEAATTADLKKAMQQALGSAVANGEVSVHETRDGLTISLQEAGFFASGSAEVHPAMLPLLRRIAASLPDRDLRVEGHTDNMPVHNDRFRSNWELSTARAVAIADALMTHCRLAPSHFSLAGYGPFRPVAGNGTAQGRAQNRRVDIVLLGTTSSLASMAGPSSAAPLLVAASSGARDGLKQQPLPATLAQQLATDRDRAAAK